MSVLPVLEPPRSMAVVLRRQAQSAHGYWDITKGFRVSKCVVQGTHLQIIKEIDLVVLLFVRSHL